MSGSTRIRNWFANHLGVGPERKAQVCIELSKSVTLLDASYWLQIIFAAGIATLGLVLNSPAVIIGAMLISPLMGPILAAGLSLATGDLVLAVRAITNLLLSSLVAVGFAVLLVSLLPFKEITHEIAARTQPNTLDLLVALFSGAVGSVAICKEVKGVVTSIPGVAIAVALMPPLGVVGYGIGVAASLNVNEGIQTARGGGLLFLTNLAAITFTAMIVLLLLRLDTDEVKNQVKDWQVSDRESAVVLRALARTGLLGKGGRLTGAPARVILVLIPIVILLIPLSRSFQKLNTEITKQQQENKTRKVALAIWNGSLARTQDGQPRSYLDHIGISDRDGKVLLSLRVFTTKPLTPKERAEYSKLVAAALTRPTGSVRLELIEIPTASSQVAIGPTNGPTEAEQLSVASLQSSFASRLAAAMSGLVFPEAAELVSYRTITDETGQLHVSITYLSDGDIAAGAQTLIVSEIRTRLDYPRVEVTLERIPATVAIIKFRRNRTTLSASDESDLDIAGRYLDQQANLNLQILATAEKGEPEKTAEQRAKVAIDYVASKWKISAPRVIARARVDTEGMLTIRLVVAEGRDR